MSDELLPYYNRELAFLRGRAKEFAAANPRVAGHLRLSGDAVDDPHVARLIEAVAFLNARTARKLDDEFPELIDTLLETLYPHYLAPIPSMSVVRFTPSAEMTKAHLIPAGSGLEAEPVKGETCRFRTCYPVTLWPIELTEAFMMGQPLAAPANPEAEGAPAALGLTLRCQPEDMTFAELLPDRLRFYLRGQPSHVFALHQMLLNDTISVALASRANDPSPKIVPAGMVQAVGFTPGEALLPYPPQSQYAYRILSEYFIFPEKFLFFDVVIPMQALAQASRELHIFLYFRKRIANLERSVTKDLFTLGCTPIVNLFNQRAEPIPLNQNRLEYRVIPDCRREDTLEVHSLLGVTATDAAGRQEEAFPLYAPRRSASSGGLFWASTRRAAKACNMGTDLYLAFSSTHASTGDPGASSAIAPEATPEWVVTVETLSTNRDLPTRLPYGGSHPRFNMRDGSNAISGISCMTPPTHPLHNRDAQSHHRRLVSHLSLNHLSLTGEHGLEALKAILRLYDFRRSTETMRMIDGIVGLTGQRGTARTPVRPGDPPWGDALCRGIDINITFDPDCYTGSSYFLFAMVLDHFFSLYATINSFSRLTVSVRAQPGILHTWPARAGDRQIL